MKRPNPSLAERVARLEGKVSVLTRLNVAEFAAILSILGMLLARAV